MGRVGIELSPVACRIVEIDGAGSKGGRRLETRVRSYVVLPAGGPEMSGRLTGFRLSDAAVIVWGMRSAHHRADVSGGYDTMLSKGLESARESGISTEGMFADVATAGRREKGTGNHSVIVAMAPSDEVSLAIRPIVDAGLRVRSVTTPAGALVSLARLRGVRSTPGSVEAFIALEEAATAVTLIRDGALIAARELQWGFLDNRDEMFQPRVREDIAARLVVDLAALCSASALTLSSVSQIAICGGLGNLRSMTISMMEVVDAEVEPLDALIGIEAGQLPEPADDFQERSAELRLAWAVAADWPGPFNLIRHRQRRARRTVLARAAVIAGVGVGVTAGWLIQRSPSWQSTGAIASPSPPRALTRSTPPATKPAPAPPEVREPSPPSPTTPAATTPQATLTTALPVPALNGVPSAPERTPAPNVSKPAAAASTGAAPKPTPLPSPATAPTAVPFPSLSPAPRASVPRASPTPVAPITAPASQPRAAVSRPQSPPEPARGRPEPLPTPFDAILGSILYSPDRKLAVIDGRIVSEGDEVKGARVIDIAPAGVTLRDSQGRLRTLVLATPGP